MGDTSVLVCFGYFRGECVPDSSVLTWEGGVRLFAVGDSVFPCQGHDWSRSCPKSYHRARNFT
jgi:hypothetical protein